MTLSSDPFTILVLINVMLFIAGRLIDTISIYYIFFPILIPIMKHFQWDLVLFVVMTLNLAISQIAPPVVVNLYVIANIVNFSLESISRSVAPFVAITLVALFVTMLFPSLLTFLSLFLGLKQTNRIKNNFFDVISVDTVPTAHQ